MSPACLGWFRSDSLEELVGLYITYHGGQTTGGPNNIEFQEAMKIKKSIESATKKGFFKRKKTQHLEQIDALVKQVA